MIYEVCFFIWILNYQSPYWYSSWLILTVSVVFHSSIMSHLKRNKRPVPNMRPPLKRRESILVCTVSRKYVRFFYNDSETQESVKILWWQDSVKKKKFQKTVLGEHHLPRLLFRKSVTIYPRSTPVELSKVNVKSNFYGMLVFRLLLRHIHAFNIDSPILICM